MRIKKGSIRGRVKSEIPIVFTQEKLTSYGGLEIFRRYLDRSGFTDRLREAFSLREFDGDYGSFRITLALIGMLLVGGSRIRHLRHLEQDPVFLRFTRLQRLPTDRTVSNTLKETTSAVREELSTVLRELAYDVGDEGGATRSTRNAELQGRRMGCLYLLTTGGMIGVRRRAPRLRDEPVRRLDRRS